MNFKVIFHLDGSGVYIDPSEPLHLDALLAWVLAPHQTEHRCLDRGDIPTDIKLPLLRGKLCGVEVWRASALFLDGADMETLRRWRKRFRQGRSHLTSGSPNLKSGVYRDYDHPISLVLAPKLVAYASGNRGELKSLLREVRALGKKRGHGHGKIVNIEYAETDADYSWWRDGASTRWLPHPEGERIVRSAPPYWNSIGAVKCAEIGTPQSAWLELPRCG